MKLYQHVPLGYALTIEADGVTSGIYVQVVPGSIYTPAAFDASSTTLIGPFNDARDYEIDYVGNAPALSCVQSGVYTAVDDAAVIKNTNNVADLTALGETNIPAIDDAGELAIAPITIGTVNDILDVLIAAGLMDAPE